MYDDNGNQIMTLDDIADVSKWADKLVPLQDDFLKNWESKLNLTDITKNINVNTSIPDYSKMLNGSKGTGNTYNFDKLIECPNITDKSTEDTIYRVLGGIVENLPTLAEQRSHIN